MSIVRQDAWTNDEDLVLAEVVLRHIREGSTQLAAFEEVGGRLNRTAAACGFRWNSAIRKNYEAAIAIAKKQRKNLKNTRPNTSSQERGFKVEQEQVKVVKDQADVQTDITIDAVIQFLTKQKESIENTTSLLTENKQLRIKIQELQEDNDKLERTLTDLKDNYQVIKTDYQMLMDIMNRAKQFTV